MPCSFTCLFYHDIKCLYNSLNHNMKDKIHIFRTRKNNSEFIKFFEKLEDGLRFHFKIKLYLVILLLKLNVFFV